LLRRVDAQRAVPVLDLTGTGAGPHTVRCCRPGHPTAGP